MNKPCNTQTSANEPTKDDDDRPTVPELEDFEEDDLDDLFEKLQGKK